MNQEFWAGTPKPSQRWESGLKIERWSYVYVLRDPPLPLNPVYPQRSQNVGSQTYILWATDWTFVFWGINQHKRKYLKIL